MGISKNLFAIYTYLSRRLAEANLNKDPEIIREVINVLESLKDGWCQAMGKCAAELEAEEEDNNEDRA